MCPADSGAGPLSPLYHRPIQAGVLFTGVDVGTTSHLPLLSGQVWTRKQRRVKLFKKLLANDAVRLVFTRTIPAIVCTVWDLSAFLVKLRVT